MKKLIFIVCFAILGVACSSSDSIEEGANGENPDENENQAPELKVNLQFPHEDGLCNVGTNITPTQSTVVFEWEASTIAEGYTITVTNLISGNTIVDETTEDKIGIVLNRATPYSWFVASKAGARTENSDVWKFYNAGPGVQTYAPFPATLNAPNMAASVNAGNVTLLWTGSDVDDDIAGYDVYFGTSNNPSIHASDVSASQLQVSVASGTIYYWKIVTKDATGNTSESGTFQFRVL